MKACIKAECHKMKYNKIACTIFQVMASHLNISLADFRRLTVFNLGVTANEMFEEESFVCILLQYYNESEYYI